MAEELTDEQIAAEKRFLKGIPRVNVGALFMPGIWGPAHGFWICILFYPIWVFADNMFFAAVMTPSAMSIALAVVTFVALVAVTVVFAILSQPYAAHRAIEGKGMSKEEYLRRERIWAVVCIVIGIVFLAWATYYNIAVRMPGFVAG